MGKSIKTGYFKPIEDRVTLMGQNNSPKGEGVAFSFDVSKYINEIEISNSNQSKGKYINSICKNDDKNDLDSIMAKLYNNTSSTVTKRSKQNIDELGNAVININIEEKTLPIALRKRLMMQRMVS